MVDNTTRQLTGDVTNFLKHWPREDVTIEEDGLSSGVRMDAKTGMSRSATNVWTISHVKRTIISAKER